MHFSIACLLLSCLGLGVIGFPAFYGVSENLEERGNYFEGDIILDAKNGIIGESYRWPENTVVYIIDPEFDADQKAKLLAAWEEITQYTCIQFRERTDTETNHVFVRKREDGAGCSSSVGHLGQSQQFINLEASCVDRHGTLIHEMIHTIGFYHEQSRPDRDDYITVQYENVESGKEHNFNKYSYSEVTTLDVKYDYGSIMHYSAFGFSNNGEPTIVAKENTNLTMGQRVEMSSSDILKIQKLYGCDQSLYI